MEFITFYIILIAGVVATTVMTLFSHLVSKIRKHEFNEAQLLNKFIDATEFLPDVNKENAIWGWLIHYTMGIIFAAWMYCIFKSFDSEITLWLGGILGLIAGMIGAVGWMGLFALHSKPPRTDVKEFIIQLLMAHCIFGVIVSFILIMYM